MTTLERIDAEIDRVWHAKWATEEREAGGHEKYELVWEQRYFCEIPLGKWVYEDKNTAYGIASHGSTLLVPHQGYVPCDPARTFWFMAQRRASKPCTCEVCAGVRERHAFMAAMERRKTA